MMMDFIAELINLQIFQLLATQCLYYIKKPHLMANLAQKESA
jgi:hypothetical protein